MARKQEPAAEAVNGAPAPPFEVLPAVDLLGGHVVRLVRGDFGTETPYASNPAAIAARFAAEGARWIHVVDLDGAREGEPWNHAAIAQVVDEVRGRVHCEVAGGLRSEEAVDAVFTLGADRIVVGTAALLRPAMVGALVARFGSDRIAVALDVRGGLAVGQGWVSRSGDGVPVAEAMARLEQVGVTTFEVTAIERDGTLEGPDLALLERLNGRTGSHVIASAGVRSVDDLRAVRAIGCTGAIIGRALYEGRLSIAAALAAVG